MGESRSGSNAGQSSKARSNKKFLKLYFSEAKRPILHKSPCLTRNITRRRKRLKKRKRRKKKRRKRKKKMQNRQHSRKNQLDRRFPKEQILKMSSKLDWRPKKVNLMNS